MTRYPTKDIQVPTPVQNLDNGYVCMCACVRELWHVNVGGMKLLLNEYGTEYAKINKAEAVQMAWQNLIFVQNV